jgi:hypothetical protein
LPADADEIERVSRIVYDGIFNDEPSVEIDGEVYTIEVTSRAHVKYIMYRGMRFIEQNPKKSSQWAKKAQEGHQIMWVMEGRRYLARMMDGRYLDLRKK